MKAIKTLLAASALATVAGAANATVWDVTMNATVFFPTANGDLLMTGFTGTYDDVANTGSWHGTTSIPGFATTLWYDQTFTMNEATGTGTLATLTNCGANTVSACQGFSGALQGGWRNTQGVGAPMNNNSYKKAYAFTPADGATYQWTLQVFKPTGQTDASGNPILDYVPMPMNVTLHAQQTPEVPVPAAAWLFGSALLGLAGTARRRRS